MSESRYLPVRFGQSVATTAATVNNLVQAAIGIVTVVVTVVAWWQFGIAWGLVAFLTMSVVVLTATGLQLQTQVDVAFTPPSFLYENAIFRSHFRIPSQPHMMAIAVDVIFANGSDETIVFRVEEAAVTVDDNKAIPAISPLDSKAEVSIRPNTSLTFGIGLSTDTTTRNRSYIHGQFSYVAVYRKATSAVQFRQRATADFNWPLRAGKPDAKSGVNVVMQSITNERVVSAPKSGARSRAVSDPQ